MLPLKNAPWELLLPGRQEALLVLGTLDPAASAILAGRSVHRAESAGPFTTIVIFPDGPSRSEAGTQRLRTLLRPDGYVLRLTSTRRDGASASEPPSELRFLADGRSLWRPDVEWAEPLRGTGKIELLRRVLRRPPAVTHEIRLLFRDEALSGKAWVLAVLAEAGERKLGPLDLGRIDRTRTGLSICRVRHAITGKMLALKVPADERSRIDFEHETRVLEALSRRGFPETIARAIPSTLAVGQHLGLDFRLESWIDGAVGSRFMYRFAEREHAVDSALRWVTELHRQTVGPRLAAIEQSRRVLEVLQVTAGRAGVEEAGFAAEVARYVEQVFGQHAIHGVQGHGDFWLGNLILDPSTRDVAGVVDWTWADGGAPPLEDPLHLLLYRKGLLSAYKPGARLARLLRGRISRRDRRRIAAYALALDLPPRSLAALALFYWVRYLDTRAGFFAGLREGFAGAYLPVRRVVERLGAHGLDDLGARLLAE